MLFSMLCYVMLFIFCSGSGLLARVTTLFPCGRELSYVAIWRFEHAMELLTTLRHANRLKYFWLARYRFTRASGENQVVKKGVFPLSQTWSTALAHPDEPCSKQKCESFRKHWFHELLIGN